LITTFKYSKHKNYQDANSKVKPIEIISVIPEKVTILYKVRTREEDSRLGEDPAFDDIIWPEYPKDDPRFQ
jgi:hypothetical protein